MGTQAAHAQPTTDPRVADLVNAGKVRVGIGLGSATLAIKNPATGEVRGPALDLARALAARIGIDLQPVEYPRPGAVIEGVRTNAWDVAFLIIDPARAAEADFSAPYMESDFTYLVPAGSSIRSLADVDQPGVRVANPTGDAAGLLLSRRLKRAQLVRPESIAAAVDLLRTGGADARAGPRPVLLSEAARLPGYRVLDEGFATISFAALVPKGNPGRLAYVGEFIEEAKSSGLVKRTIESAGLRGVQVAPAGKPGTR
ncbi:MAG: transporter substrate-binding domain-containing protein [Betaproteobacteria bacterium]|nr:transporter substrate-binding domain-containing protein [Betaproteobacteria bacterium]